MEIPFIGGAYQDKSLNLDAQTCQNLSIVVDQQGGKSILSLEGVPGGMGWSNLGFYTRVKLEIPNGDEYAFVTHYHVNLKGSFRYTGTTT